MAHKALGAPTAKVAAIALANNCKTRRAFPLGAVAGHKPRNSSGELALKALACA
jgi:hypothetical protein